MIEISQRSHNKMVMPKLVFTTMKFFLKCPKESGDNKKKI